MGVQPSEPAWWKARADSWMLPSELHVCTMAYAHACAHTETHTEMYRKPLRRFRKKNVMFFFLSFAESTFNKGNYLEWGGRGIIGWGCVVSMVYSCVHHPDLNTHLYICSINTAERHKGTFKGKKETRTRDVNMENITNTIVVQINFKINLLH